MMDVSGNELKWKIILNQPIGLDNEILRACDPNRIERSFLV